MTDTTFDVNVFTESAKALMDICLGEDNQIDFQTDFEDYFTLLREVDQLRSQVASLSRDTPYQEKYENLSKEFRKIASERDQLRAQQLSNQSLHGEYDRLLEAYQTSQRELAATKKAVEELKSSTSWMSLLEGTYQALRGICDKNGCDIRRRPARLTLSLYVPSLNKGFAQEFERTSATNWKKVNLLQH